MSYNYDEILANITVSRKSAYSNYNNSKKNYTKIDIEKLNESVELLSDLSIKCPLPIKLWIQYAHDAGLLLQLLDDSFDESNSTVLETKCSIYEMGILCYPASIILRRYHIQSLFSLYKHKKDLHTQLKKACDDIFELIQYGTYYSHTYNTELDVIWDIMLEIHDNKDEVFLKRSSCIVENWNESLLQDVLQYCKNTEVLKKMEENRKEASRYVTLVAPLEDSIQECLQVDQLQYPDEDDWWWVSPDTTSNVGMGLGSISLAQAFTNHIQKVEKNISNPIIQSTFIKQMYERAIVECPTIELLWIQYIRYLQKQPQDVHSIIERSIKNCPYSVTLFTIQLQYTWEFNCNNNSDDWIISSYVNIVEQARTLKFLPNVESYIQLYLELCRIPTRYFQQQNIASLSSSTIQKNITTIRKLYDTSIKYLQSDVFVTKQYMSILYYNRAYFESYIVSSLENDEDIKSNSITYFEKCIQSNPYNIQYWKEYITYHKCILEDDVNVIRKLYQRAITSFFSVNNNKRSNNEIDIDLKSLELFYQEYKTFEYHFGSSQIIQNDLPKFDKKYSMFVYKYNQTQQQKRKYNDTSTISNKKIKLGDGSDEDNDVTMKSSPEKKTNKTANLSKKKQKEYITINHLKYPVHPYTIQVSNLPLSTKHNDLLKIFESFENADIVYARMLHHKPKRNTKPITFKKALIQFYTSDACDKIINYVNEGIDITYEGNVLDITRSHIPALEKNVPDDDGHEKKKVHVKKDNDGKDTAIQSVAKKKQQYNRQHKRLDIDDIQHMKIDEEGEDTIKKQDTSSNVKELKSDEKYAGSIFAFHPRTLKK